MKNILIDTGIGLLELCMLSLLIATFIYIFKNVLKENAITVFLILVFIGIVIFGAFVTGASTTCDVHWIKCHFGF